MKDPWDHGHDGGPDSDGPTPIPVRYKPDTRRWWQRLIAVLSLRRWYYDD